jgi:hypothetical protein
MAKIVKQFKTGLPNFFVLIAIIVTVMVYGTLGQSANVSQNNGTSSNNLVLNIYIDDTGRSLVTGFANDISGLPFLITSQYKYDKDTKQLYALTNSLTNKSGDGWEMKFLSMGNYSEYHSIFYLPPSIKISNIFSSPGLNYLVSASNDSFQVDLHGYDVKNPITIIYYQIPVGGTGGQNRLNTNLVILTAFVLGLALASASLILVVYRKRAESSSKAFLQNGASKKQDITPLGLDNGVLKEGNDEAQIFDENEDSGSQDFVVIEDELPVEIVPQNSVVDPSGLSENLTAAGDEVQHLKVGAEIYEANMGIPKKDEFFEEGIKITGEMLAVMETLNSRDRAVLTVLIEHKGLMTQADIRYETRIPKSSLTGIILSLERRKLITKKERGRTNVIALSEWFLSSDLS